MYLDSYLYYSSRKGAREVAEEMLRSTRMVNQSSYACNDNDKVNCHWSTGGEMFLWTRRWKRFSMHEIKRSYLVKNWDWFSCKETVKRLFIIKWTKISVQNIISTFIYQFTTTTNSRKEQQWWNFTLFLVWITSGNHFMYFRFIW